MATCPKCGAETKEDDKFCHSCGASLEAKTNIPQERKSSVQEKDICFGEGERRRDYSGLMSFGIFLLIVGIVFIINPSVFSDFRFWVEKMTSEKVLSRPPQGLITSATLFFGLIGVSDFFVAGVRFMADKRKRRVLVDILSGIALILFSYLIHLYGGHALAWQVVLAIEVVACGLLVVLYSVLLYLFPKKLQ